jgi:hypothetical protein
MGKNASKNFVNQFKNTRRQAGRQAAIPLVGHAGRRPLGGPARHLKNLFPAKPKDDKNTDQGGK